MFHKVGEVLLCFRTSRGDHFISFRVFCSIVQPPLPSNQSPITRCHGPLHPQQRGQLSSITCSSFHFHYRRTTPKETHSDEWSRTPGSRMQLTRSSISIVNRYFPLPVYKGYGAGDVQTEMLVAKKLHYLLTI